MPPAFALTLALVSLAMGPLLAAVLERRAGFSAFLDGFVLVTVGGLSFLFLLPDAYAAIGAGAIPVALAGLIVPWLSERHLHGRAESSPTFVVLALVGLLLHSTVDGAALAVGAEHVGHGHAGHGHAGDSRLDVALAVAAHRLPVGLLIWSVVPGLLGRRWALLTLGSLMLATVGGFSLSPSLGGLGAGLTAGVIQALLAGGLLHVVLDHGPEVRREHRWAAPSSALGALLALGLFAALPLEPVEALRGAALAALRIFEESSLAILLGFLGAGLLSLVPTVMLARLMTGRTPFGSALRGVIFGLPIPICSCGVVPVYRSLMNKGVPPAAAMAFLIATPELGVDAVAISIPLLGIELTLVRLAAALSVALITGLVFGLLLRGTPPTEAGEGCDSSEEGPQQSRLQRALHYGFVESLDDLGPWILAGIVVAGLMEPLFAPGWLAAIPPAAEVPLFSLLAAPFYVCASAATPVGAALLVKGASAGAVIAFLLTGPATNLTTYGAIRAFHGRRATFVAIAAVLGVSVALGLLINGLDPALGRAEAVAAHEPGLLGHLTAGLFIGLLTLSFLRQGPRGFLQRLGLTHHHGQEHGEGEEEHEQEHGQEHEHEHGEGEEHEGDSCCS